MMMFLVGDDGVSVRQAVNRRVVALLLLSLQARPFALGAWQISFFPNKERFKSLVPSKQISMRHFNSERKEIKQRGDQF